MADEYDNFAPSGSDNPRRRVKHALAVRMFVAKLAWLGGALYWRDGRISWEGAHGATTPAARDLSRAQRSLNKIAQYKNSARSVLGDSAAWIAERRANLELAKRLSVICEPDVANLAQRASERHPDTLGRLTALLPAEALCLNTLPASPSRALMLAGEPAEPLLIGMASDKTLPPVVASLAAMTLGAAHARRLAPPFQIPALQSFRSSYAWGYENDLPDHPALIASLLIDNNGSHLARRCIVAVQMSAQCSFTVEEIRILVAENGPETAIHLTEAIIGFEPLISRLFSYRDVLPGKDSKNRLSAAKRYSAECNQRKTELTEIVHQYFWATRAPDIAHDLRQFLEAMERFEFSPYNWEFAFLQPLRAGLSLKTALQHDYLALLARNHHKIWNYSEGMSFRAPGTDVGPNSRWLSERWNSDVQPLIELLEASHALDVVQRAFTLQVHRDLWYQKWPEREMFAFALSLVERYQAFAKPSFSILDHCGNVREARAILHPLIEAIEKIPDRLRGRLFYEISNACSKSFEAMRALITRVIILLPTVITFCEIIADQVLEAPCIHLVKECPETPAENLARYLHQFLDDRSRAQLMDGLYGWELSEQLIVSATLAFGNVDAFRRIFKASGRVMSDQNWLHLRIGIKIGLRFPQALASLARIFPDQPKRCTDLLIRLALSERLGTEVTKPLASFVPTAITDEAVSTFYPVVLCHDAGWRRVIALLPEAGESIMAYQHARWILGEPAELTPGMRQVLDQPKRWKTELERLDTMIQEMPERADLIKRANRLRERIADTEQWRAQARAELTERLQTVTDEAQIRALEHLVEKCFLHRLDIIAAPIPPGTVMTPDLMNATLLSADITQNKKLLQRLLRAHLTGISDWREQHPANATFLQSLATTGIDAKTWLSEYPRRYVCPDVPGETLHVRLERSPLHILQMGNYFGTCLSLDGCNSFSTIANAAELNKRVLYVRDGNGTVVGRKLIGIRADGKLIGFRTYASLADHAANKALRAIIRRYVQRFAERCGLTLADDGTVPKLFAEVWYDDGVVAWNEDAPSIIPAPSPPIPMIANAPEPLAA